MSVTGLNNGLSPPSQGEATSHRKPPSSGSASMQRLPYPLPSNFHVKPVHLPTLYARTRLRSVRYMRSACPPRRKSSLSYQNFPPRDAQKEKPDLYMPGFSGLLSTRKVELKGIDFHRGHFPNLVDRNVGALPNATLNPDGYGFESESWASYSPVY